VESTGHLCLGYCANSPFVLCVDVTVVVQEKEVVDSTGHLCLGSSMVELVKHSEERGIELLSLRAPDGTPSAAWPRSRRSRGSTWPSSRCSTAPPPTPLPRSSWLGGPLSITTRGSLAVPSCA